MAALFVEDSGDGPETVAFAKKLMQECYASRDESDGLLSRHAHNWDLSRLALEDTVVLQILLLRTAVLLL